jgi:glyoxylase-like metal-dependent hydrolase (beta-lactamase superfamily II)
MNSNLTRLTVGALSANCWVYAYDGGVAVIDPGGDAQAIIAFLESQRLQPTHILLTHGHFDHIMALPEVRSVFPNAEVAVHRADYVFVDENALKRHCSDFRAIAGNDSFIRANWQEMPPVARLLEDSDIIGPFTVVHTPGHTKGSVSYYHEGARILFSGDTLFRDGIGRTDLSGGDMNEMTESLKRLFTLDGATQVFPGHGDPTTIGTERIVGS